jgi:transcriptional regulator with XRE-family HTH domain
MNSFSDRLKAIRDGRTQREMAGIIGWNQALWERYESGRVANPGIDVLLLLCSKLKISADWLLGLSDNQQIDSTTPVGPSCPDCRRRDDQIDELFSQLRVMRSEVEKKVGNSESQRPSSASGARKRGA